MTLLSVLADECDDIDGLDLEDDEKLYLLNEANTELCVRSGWTRAGVELGPTVTDQATYATTDEIYEPLEVYVDGTFYYPSSKKEASRISNGELRLVVPGLWWLDYDDQGAETITIFNTPSTAGATITAVSTVYPDELALTDQPTPPRDFHRALKSYVAKVSIGGSEDDLDRAAIHSQEFDRQVARLRAHAILRRAGSGPRPMKIVGRTA